MRESSDAIETRVPIFKGLKFRMLLAGLLPTVIVMTVLIWSEARHEFDALRAASLESLQSQAELLAKHVQEVNESARESVFALADAQAAGMIDYGQMSIDFPVRFSKEKPPSPPSSWFSNRIRMSRRN